MKNSQQRYWEIDSLRGIAILMMVAYHVYFDVYFLGILPVGLFSAPYIGTMFLFLVGVSLTLSYSRTKQTLTGFSLLLKFLKRGLFIFCLGLGITLVTWIAVPQYFIVFGILHCIGLSIIFAIPFIHGKIVPALLGLFCIFCGMWLFTLSWPFPWLFWAGFIPQGFQSLDYFPMLPWFGVVLLGIATGNLLYPQGKRLFALPDVSENSILMFLSFLGEHSLKIYVLHQPILIAFLLLIKTLY